MNQVNIELRNAKRIYYCTRITGQNSNPKEAWKSINQILGRQTKQMTVNELNIGENILSDPQEIADGFNDYFSNIGPNLASKIDVPNCNFETYMKKAKSEFTAFQPTTVNNVQYFMYYPNY